MCMALSCRKVSAPPAGGVNSGTRRLERLPPNPFRINEPRGGAVPVASREVPLSPLRAACRLGADVSGETAENGIVGALTNDGKE